MKNIFVILTFILIISLSSCTTLIKGLSDSLYEQKDIVLVEQGAPSYLILVEGLIRSEPKNKQYLITGIQMFSAYSSAFIKEDDRKKIFADKTKEWGIKLLRTYYGYVKYEKTEDREKKEVAFQSFLKSLTKNDVENVFWAANAWIMWILTNLDSTDAFIELPIAKALIDRVYKLDDKYYYGAPHLYYGVFYGAFPKDFGGNLEKAKEEFDIALKLSGDKFLATKLFYANFYLKPKNDKKEFERVVREVIDFDLEQYPSLRLINTVAKKQAEEMLANINEMFFDDVN
ncbi:MAG: hypothetical protein A2086_14650 [Spirochaetes bacterium GWD1_27_9]|nr:MAG: hypothetical protein A2Z98_04750 [Spirochaetes bacterium GWB1_27_13]OHD24949.1 MAG: hypothetical protein A2Y34_06215 [Spirochaetes bacterium GWC1_27_15]OHD38547.1 MAG: hypothetical protein A2086_14650 [Spirochaetes bacterium GWD1_27_9]